MDVKRENPEAEEGNGTLWVKEPVS